MHGANDKKYFTQFPRDQQVEDEGGATNVLVNKLSLSLITVFALFGEPQINKTFKTVDNY